MAWAPGQRTYELIRPVVLFGQSPAERAAETGAAQRTLYRQVARFDQLGMASLVPPPKVEKHRSLPAEVRQTILDAKREHPPLWTWGEGEWLPVLRLPAYAPRKSRPPGAVQPPLFALEEVSA